MDEEQDIAAFVKKLTDDLNVKLATMVDNVVTKIDTLTQRIEDLEKSAAEISSDR